VNYYRQEDWSPLGWHHDPVPGAPEIVEDYAGRFRTTATQAGEAARLLESFSRSGMVSYSVDKLLAESTALAGRLTLVESRYVGAAGALSRYAPELRSARDRSWELLQQAGPLREQERRAHDHSNEMYWQLQFMPCGPQRDGLVDQYQANERARAAQKSNIQNVKDALKQICNQRDSAAENAASIIKRAMEASGLNDTIVDHVQEFFHKVDSWLKDHAGSLSAWGTGLGYLSLGLKVAGVFFPPLAIAGTVVGFAAAGLKMAGEFGKARKTGDWKSFWVEAAFTAVGLGSGKVLGKVGRAIVPKLGAQVHNVIKGVRYAAYKVIRLVPTIRASTALKIIKGAEGLIRNYVVKPLVLKVVHDPGVLRPTPYLPRLPGTCAPPPCYPQPVMNCQRVYVGAPA